jgi:osmoprotectant transport system permease protein
MDSNGRISSTNCTPTAAQAGVRVAKLCSIIHWLKGSVVTAAWSGLGGYGFFILRGLNTFFWTQLLVGVALSVVLATVLDLSFVGIEKWLTPWNRDKGAAQVKP